jgi:hypothetical protein
MIVIFETNRLNSVVTHGIFSIADAVVLFDPLPTARHKLLRLGLVSSSVGYIVT